MKIVGKANLTRERASKSFARALSAVRVLVTSADMIRRYEHFLGRVAELHQEFSFGEAAHRQRLAMAGIGFVALAVGGDADRRMRRHFVLAF